MPFTKIQHPVHPMTVEAASNYASHLLEMEQRGSDTESALHRLEQRYGLSPNQIMHLRSRRAKSCDVSLFARLRGAYLDLCARQVSKLQHQIAVEKAMNGDDTLDDLEGEASRLAAKIAARRQAMIRKPSPSDD